MLLHFGGPAARVPLSGREYALPALQRMSHSLHCQNWPNLSSWGQGGDRVEAEGLASNHLPQDLTLEGFQRPLLLSILWICPEAQGCWLLSRDSYVLKVSKPFFMGTPTNSCIHPTLIDLLFNVFPRDDNLATPRAASPLIHILETFIHNLTKPHP